MGVLLFSPGKQEMTMKHSKFQIALRGISAAQDARDSVNMNVDAGVAAANGTSVAQLIALDIEQADIAEAISALVQAAPAPSKYSLAYAMQQWPNNFKVHV
jgi:hypothetical protein